MWCVEIKEGIIFLIVHTSSDNLEKKMEARCVDNYKRPTDSMAIFVWLVYVILKSLRMFTRPSNKASDIITLKALFLTLFLNS